MNESLRTLTLRALRASMGAKEGLKLRESLMKLGATDKFQYSLKQALLFRELLNRDKNTRYKVFIKEKVSEDELMGCIKVAEKQSSYASELLIKKTLSKSPTNKWFSTSEIDLPLESSKRGLEALFILGKLKKMNKGRGNQYFLLTKDKPTYKSSELHVDSVESRLLKVLIKLDSFGTSGTRQSIQNFLKDKKAPNYVRVSQVLFRSGHIMKDSSRTVNYWNRERVGSPNIHMASKILEKAKKLARNPSTRKNEVQKELVNQEDLFQLLYDLSEGRQDSKKVISEFLSKKEMVSEFKEFYISREIGKKLEFLD
jgi:hypothetical protein